MTTTLANRPRNSNYSPGLNTRSGELGNVCALSEELRNELDRKRSGPLLIFATVDDWIVSGDLRNRSPIVIRLSFASKVTGQVRYGLAARCAAVAMPRREVSSYILGYALNAPNLRGQTTTGA
jgi:hypothetical protein